MNRFKVFQFIHQSNHNKFNFKFDDFLVADRKQMKKMKIPKMKNKEY